jgi:pimeloyl-ACP methyl ester carboxylesterase
MFFLIFLLTLFISSTPVYAQEFFDYSENPIVTKSGTSTAVAQPYVSRNGNIFSIWFADVVGGGRVAISSMKSANGIDWYDKKILNISDKMILTDPYMFEDNGQFKLYFATSINGVYSIWMSSSSDGETFIPGQEIQVLKSEYSWERSNISTPAIVKSNNLYYLYYEGNGSVSWSTGLATSTDGVNWQKCSNNPQILGGGAPQVVNYNSIYYLFFHTAQGVEVQQTETLNGCDTVWTNRHLTNLHFSDPAPIQVGNDLWVYGFSNTSSGMTIWLSANIQIPKPSYPVVIVPGMFASWNKEAILHNETVTFDTWKLNPSVSEYDALKITLGNRASFFAYDWRKPIIETADTLNAYLTNTYWSTNPYQPIQLIGHSLGGVVSRVYADKYPNKPIKQVVTSGSPHLGLVQAYKPLADGEIDRENTLIWLAQKLILLLNKSLFQSNKEAISQKFPVLYDILPSFPFLKNAEGSFIPSELENTLISVFPIQPTPKIPQYYIGGAGHQTLAGYTPTSSWTEDGDGLIPLKSSLNQINPAQIQNHGSIIYSKESIKAILSKLNISVQDSDIPDGKGTDIFPAIMVFLQSPATAEITYNGLSSTDEDGMIWVQNAEDGSYSLKIKGTADGEYTANIWLIGATDDKWIQFKKQTTAGKVDEYSISFDTNSGGTATEYIPPTPTFTPSPTPTLTIKPTIKPKPTAKPHPTKVPKPTKKPIPTKTPPKQHNMPKLGHLIQIIIKFILQSHKK